jgi:DNA repair exonuclease SbcCD ATPase subunit
MKRKILAGVLIGFSSIILLASLIGVVLAWVYNEPLTLEATSRLEEVETQLNQIQTDLRKAKDEVERALRIIQSAEDALASLTQQTADAKELLEQVNKTLDADLIPGLKNTRSKISEVRAVLEDLRNALEQLNSLPLVNFDVPGDEVIANIINGVDSLDAEIANVQDLAQRASVFIGDTSYLLGGDFQTTKQNLQDLLQVLKGYDAKLTAWLEQVRTLKASAPKWIDNASISLTVALLWSAFSQFGLLLHGLSIWYGENPLDVLKRLSLHKKDAD